MASSEKMSSVCVVNNSLSLSNGSSKNYPALQSLEITLKDNRKKYVDKVQALLWAWEHITNCMNKEFSPTVFDFMHGQTLYLVLRGDWPKLKPVIQTHLLVLLRKCLKYLKAKNIASSISRCNSLINLVANPWGHSTLNKLIQGQPTTDAEVMEYCDSEKGDLIMIRLELLIVSKCEDMALNLAAAAVRWMRVPNSGCESNSTRDQRNFFLDVYLTTLFRFKKNQDIITELGHLDLNEGLELVKRYRSASWPSSYNSSPSNGTSSARIWRYGSRVAEIAAHKFLASAMVQPPSPLLADLVLEWAVIYGSSPQDLFGMIKKFLQTAESVEHVYIFSEVLVKQFGDRVKPICIEFCVRFLSADLNDLSLFKMKSELEKQREIEIKLSSGFLKLADLIGNGYVDMYRECVLTGFSLNPTNETLDIIKSLAAGNESNSACNSKESNRPSNIKTNESVPATSSTSESINKDMQWGEVNERSKNIAPDKHGTVTEPVTEVCKMAEMTGKITEMGDARRLKEINEQDSNEIKKMKKEDANEIQVIDQGNLKEAVNINKEDSCETRNTNEQNSNKISASAISCSDYKLASQVAEEDVAHCTSNFEKEGDALGLSLHLRDDLSTVIRGSRYQSLNWDHDWNELEHVCKNYLSNFSNFKDTSNKELKYLKIDYNLFKDWPEENDKDKYNGIEKGYEMWVEGTDDSDEPLSGSASCSQSINDSDFESSDSFVPKRPPKKKDSFKRRSDSDSDFELGKHRSKKRKKKKKVITDSDNGTLDSVKSTNSVLREKQVKRKNKKAKENCKGTLRSKTLVRNAKNFSSLVDDTISNESKFSDKINSDNENDNNNSTFKKVFISGNELCKETENRNVMNENKTYCRTNNLKILRTYRKPKPDLKPPSKIGFAFFNNIAEDNYSLTNGSPTYLPHSSPSTINSNNHGFSNKVELSIGYDDYSSDNCKYTFKEDEPLNISAKLKSFPKFDKSDKIKFDNFGLARDNKSAIQNTVSELSSIVNLVPSETTATVQVVQVTNHAATTCSNSALPNRQTSSSDKPAPQTTSTSSQNSPTQLNTYSIATTLPASSIKNQNAASTDSQSSSQLFSPSIQNNINALIESSETQNTSETITLQRAEPVNIQPTLKLPVQTQSTLIIQNQPGDAKQATSSNLAASVVKPPRSSAFVFVASGDSNNAIARTSGVSQQQVQQTLLNLANSPYVGTSIGNNTATLFKAEDVKKNENVVQLTVSRDSRLLLAQSVSNVKKSDSTVNVVISQSGNFTNARLGETREQNPEAQKANTATLKLESVPHGVKMRPAVSQTTQNASLPKFQQAFGRTMYQNVSCPVVSGNIAEGKVVNVMELNQVQVRDNSGFSSCPVVSKGVQTIKDCATPTPKVESSENVQLLVKEENSNNQAVPMLLPQTIAQVKTSALQTSPGVIFTCKKVGVVKEPEGSGEAGPSAKKANAKTVKEQQLRLNDLLTAAIQANAPVQASTSGPNVINIINPINQAVQISNSSDDSSKSKSTLTSPSQRVAIPSIIQKTVGRQTVLQPSTYKFKPFSASDSSQTAVLKLPLSVRSALLSNLQNNNQPINTATASNASSTNQSRIGNRESLVIRNRIDPNVNVTSMESSTTTEQLREFESVLEKVTKTSQMKERINVQLHTPLEPSAASNESNSTGFSSVASSQSNSSALTPSSTTIELQGERVLSFVTQTASSGVGPQKLSSSTPVVVVQSCRRQTSSPALSITSQSSSSPVPCSSGKAHKSSKSTKSKIVKTPPVTSPLKVTPTIPKPQQKPQEDEQTTQRIYAILDKYAEQLRNSPELKNKPAPRRRSNPPTNPTQSSKRKKSSQSRSRSNSQQASCSSGLDMSPSSEDVRTMGSEDSSNGVSQISQLTSSPPSRMDETPATPSSETSESLDARDTRIQIQVQPQPQAQPVVTSRALIVQDSSLTTAEAAKIFSTQSRQQTVMSGTGGVHLPPGTVRLLVTKGPKMYKIQQMVPMVLRPGLAKFTGGIAAQNIGTVAGQQAVVLPPGTRSFTFTEASGEQTVNLESTVIPSSISLLQLQSTNSTNANISTLTSVASTNIPNLNPTVSENSNLSITSSTSSVSQITLSHRETSSSQIILNSNNKERSVWTDLSSVEGNKQLFLELRKPSKCVKSEAASFACQNELKLEISDSPPSAMINENVRLETSTDTVDNKDDLKPTLLLVDSEIKKEPKEVEDTRDETVHWQQYCLTKDDPSQDEKSLQTMNQTVSDVDSCNTANTSLTLSHAKRKGSTLDSTLFQSTYRRSDRLQTGKRSDGAQQKKAELKSLSEECKDLGVDKPSTSDLFPEAELLLDLDPSSQEAEIQSLMNPETNYNNKECGLNFSQGDGVTNLKTYARSSMKSKLKLCSSPSSPFLKMNSDSDSPILGQSELYPSPDEKTHLKTATSSGSSNLEVDPVPQDSTFGSQQKLFSQCDSLKPNSSSNNIASCSKVKKRVRTRSHCFPSSSRSEKRSNLPVNSEPQLPPESSVNGGLDLDSDSTDFKKSLGNLIDDEEKLRENSMDRDFPSPTTPTHSSSDTVFSSDPQLNMFDSTNNPFMCGSSLNSFRSRNRSKSSQDNQDPDSFWSLLKKSDQGDDLDSDVDKTATSDTEDPVSESELTLSSNGLGRKRSASTLKTGKSKVSKTTKEDVDVASSASSPEISESDRLRVSRRSSSRGLVKKPCSCCNGSPEQPKRKNHSHISTSSCSSASKKTQSSKTPSFFKSVLKRR